MAHDSAKGLRQQLEDGLLADHPLRCLIEGALLVAINNTHYVWDRDVAKYRDEAVAARKRLDQWVKWGCRAACVVAAPDDTLRSEIDKALPHVAARCA